MLSRVLSRALALAFSLIAVAFAQGSSCGTPGPCECFACLSAIDLAVFDADGAPIDTGWTVEATVDGFAVEDIANCDPEFRFGNACSFGSRSGIYRITVRGTGFQTRELAARAAAKSGENCCDGRCIASATVSAFLDVTDVEGAQ